MPVSSSVNQKDRGKKPLVACCRCGQVVPKDSAREVVLEVFAEGRIYGWECGEECCDG